MDPSGSDYQGDYSIVSNTQNLQDWFVQREELRKWKAIIEDAERRMDYGLVGQLQQQQTESHQLAVSQPGLNIYSPAVNPVPPPPPLPFPIFAPPPVMQETAHIVEIESNPNPSRLPTASTSTTLTHSNATQAHQRYSQSGISDIASFKPGTSTMNHSHRVPVSSSVGHRNIPPTTHTTNTYYQNARHALNPTNYHSQSLTGQGQGQGQGSGSRHGTGSINARPPSSGEAAATALTSGSVPLQRQLQRSTDEGSAPKLLPSNSPSFRIEKPLAPGSAVQSVQTPLVQSSQSSTPQKQQAPVVMSIPHSMPPTSTSTLPVNPASGETSSQHQLPALTKLNEMLASHNRWSDDASSRILKSIIDVPDGGRPQASELSQPHQSSSQANEDDPPSKPHTALAHSPSEPLSPNSRLTSIINSHNEPSSAEVNPSLAPITSNGHAHGILEPGHSPPNPATDSHRVLNGGAIPVPTPPSTTVAGPPVPHTPTGRGKNVISTPSSASANRKTLARDIMWALQPPSAKRRRESFGVAEGMEHATDRPLAKKSKVVDVEGGTGAMQIPQGASRSGTSYTAPSRTQPVQPPQLSFQSMQQQQQQWHQWQQWQQRQQRQNQTAHLTTQQPSQPTQYKVQSTQQPIRSQPHVGHFSQQPNNSVQQRGQPMQQQETKGPQQQQFTYGQWGRNDKISAPGSKPPPYYPTAYQERPPISQRPQADIQPSAGPTPPQPSMAADPNPSDTPVHPKASPPTPAALPGKPVSPSKAAAPRLPLFLPSSASPPASPSVDSPRSQRPTGKTPVVEIPPSPHKLKVATGRILPKVVPPSVNAVPDLDTAEPSAKVESLFGKPTGALAAPSAITQAGLRPSRLKVYILVPQIDTTTWYSRQRTKGKKKARETRQGEITRYDDEAATAKVQDFARRLVRRSCLWKDCRAVLDSGEKLVKHVKVVHGKEHADKLYKCQWTECPSRRYFTDSENFIQHLQWHVNSRIHCGYKGCDFQTQLSVQLWEHVIEDHGTGDPMRPYAVPLPLPQPDVPPVVETLPAYMSVPLVVLQRPITRDRHQLIGPWVLHRIFGKVAIKEGAAGGAVSLRSRRLRVKQAQSASADNLQVQVPAPSISVDGYEFLKKERPTRSFGSLMSLPLLIDEVVEETGANADTDDVNDITGYGSSQPAIPSDSADPVQGDVEQREITQDLINLLDPTRVRSSAPKSGDLASPVNSSENSEMGVVVANPNGVVREEVEEVEELL